MGKGRRSFTLDQGNCSTGTV
uniref:Uncharacterized protein n=1 Tax=Arundo donax TaxID=35708 RepID=A0A0A8ZDA7_ARUDO